MSLGQGWACEWERVYTVYMLVCTTIKSNDCRCWFKDQKYCILYKGSQETITFDCYISHMHSCIPFIFNVCPPNCTLCIIPYIPSTHITSSFFIGSLNIFYSILSINIYFFNLQLVYPKAVFNCVGVCPFISSSLSNVYICRYLIRQEATSYVGLHIGNIVSIQVAAKLTLY